MMMSHEMGVVMETVLLLMIAFEELQETCLRSRGSLHATEWQAFSESFQIIKIKNEILKPETHTLTDTIEGRGDGDGGGDGDGDGHCLRRQLCRLIMSESKGGHIFVLESLILQRIDETNRFGLNQTQSRTQMQQISIIGHETTRCAQMNDFLRIWMRSNGDDLNTRMLTGQ